MAAIEARSMVEQMFIFWYVKCLLERPPPPPPASHWTPRLLVGERLLRRPLPISSMPTAGVSVLLGSVRADWPQVFLLLANDPPRLAPAHSRVGMATRLRLTRAPPPVGLPLLARGDLCRRADCAPQISPSSLNETAGAATADGLVKHASHGSGGGGGFCGERFSFSSARSSSRLSLLSVAFAVQRAAVAASASLANNRRGGGRLGNWKRSISLRTSRLSCFWSTCSGLALQRADFGGGRRGVRAEFKGGLRAQRADCKPSAPGMAARTGERLRD
jgi:hypothetical protein